MSGNLYVVVLDNEGRVIDYVAPVENGFSKIKEATQLGYDIYRAVLFVLKGLGYSEPKNIVIHYDGMELTIHPRKTHVVITIYTEPIEAPKTRYNEATVET